MQKLKVRIALAVDPSTLEWNSAGWGGGKHAPDDNEKMGFAAEPMQDGEVRYFIDAEIDVAPIAVVSGTVVEETESNPCE